MKKSAKVEVTFSARNKARKKKAMLLDIEKSLAKVKSPATWNEYVAEEKKKKVALKKKRDPSLIPLNISKLQEKALVYSSYPTSTVLRARRIIDILKKYRYQCAWCPAKEKLTIDHYYRPMAGRRRNWNTYNVDDCIVLCVTCHVKKNGWIKEVAK